MKNNMIQLFEDAQFLIQKFDKQNYEKAFPVQYEKYEGMLNAIDEQIQNSDHAEQTILEIASVIPEYVKEKIAVQKNKHKAENMILDYNYSMVTYVFPLINYNRKANNRKVSEKMLEIWNQEISKNPIQNSTYESIYDGFSKRLCYITTAVCSSLGKPDDCHELQVLRNYRDTYLMSSKEGEELVKQYYDIAPTIVKHINERHDANAVYSHIYEEYIVPCIQLVEENKLEECKAIYSNMVKQLQTKYLYS